MTNTRWWLSDYVWDNFVKNNHFVRKLLFSKKGWESDDIRFLPWGQRFWYSVESSLKNQALTGKTIRK